MSENPETDDRDAELRGKLLKRLAVAGVLVAVLLGVLAFFDYLSSSPEEPVHQVFTKPVPVPPKKEITQPVKPNTDVPEPPKTEKNQAEQPSPSPSPEPPKPQIGTTPTPAASEQKDKPTARVVPATPRPAEKSARPVPEGSAAPVDGTPSAAPVAGKPPTDQAPSAKLVPTPTAVATSPPRLVPSVVPTAELRPIAPLRGFLVQAGVFANIQAAQELHAKLALNGLPSAIEARVSVGPFKSKEEADAAREKLKSLGVDGLVLLPGKR